MKESILIDLIQNIALLLAFSMLYDYFWMRHENMKNIFYKVGAGIILGLVGIILTLTPWTFKEGVFFDARSIVLSISGLFFGFIPTFIAMIIVALFRVYLGGDGMLMGVVVIITSSLIGIAWRYLRPLWKRDNLYELIGMGLLVHIIMLCCTIFLPIQIRAEISRNIAFALFTLYPLATVLLGKLMIRQSDNWENKKALDISEKRWQYALEGAGDGVWDWNPQTGHIFFSKRWKSMLGYDSNDIDNNVHGWQDLLHEKDRDRVLEVVGKFLTKENESFEVEQRLRCKDGSYKWILATGKILTLDEAGMPIRCIGTHKDISDRKEKELLLVHERFLMDSLMAFTPESIFFKDLDSRFIRVNNASAQSMGFGTPEEVIGKSDFDIYSYNYASKTYQDEQDIIRTGKYLSEEEQENLLDGPETWGITHKMPLRDLRGDVVGTFGLSIDITERKKMEQALKESEEYTKSILTAIPDLIFILDSKGIFLDFKTGNVDDLVLPFDDFINKAVLDVFPDSVGVALMNTIDAALKEQTTMSVEYEMTLKDGVNTFECFVLPFVEEKVIAMVRNITKRKLVEEALKKSQEQLKSFAAHLQNIREEERVMLAREIHDELGQMLIALKIDMGMFKQNVIKSVKAEELEKVIVNFEQLYALLDTTIKTTRKIMTGLRPELLDLIGLIEASRLYIKEFSERYKIECKVDCPVTELDFESQQSIALFRILQEALSNVAKHSKATEVMISLNIIDNKIILKIADNGIGIDSSHKARCDSYGLIGMRERAYLLNGNLTVSGEPGDGTSIIVEMPVFEISKN